MEEKPSASIKPYLDKLTLGVTRILGEWGGGRASWGLGEGCHSVVMETAGWREGRPPPPISALRAGWEGAVPEATAWSSPRGAGGSGGAGPGRVCLCRPRRREAVGGPRLRGPAAGRRGGAPRWWLSPSHTRSGEFCQGLPSGIARLCFSHAQTQKPRFLAFESAAKTPNLSA